MLRALCIFMLGGGLLYAMDVSYSSWVESREVIRIVVTEKEISRFHDEFVYQARRAPTAEELQSLIDSYINKEILVNEAIRTGLHLTDSVVRERLVMNMGFLEQGEYMFDELGNLNRTVQDIKEHEVLFRRALAMGMAETDSVARKRLEERMTRIITRTMVEYPDNQALIDYLYENQEEFGFGKRTHLFHAFFAKGQLDRQEIDNIHQSWVSGEISDEQILSLASQSYVNAGNALSEHSLIRLFGGSKGKAIHSLQSPAVLDVHETVTGFHFLRIDNISTAVVDDIELGHFKDRVVTEYMREKENLAIERQLQHWRELYDISIDMESI